MNEKDYRAAVGPAHNYDIIGGLQFALLLALGLREHHKLLDVGCGSLRGGRLFIPYLKAGRYYGMEPAKWMIDSGFDYELGHDIKEMKMPTFIISDKFDFSAFGVKFDYILAQSILTHTSLALMRQCVANARAALMPKGIFAFTIMPGDNYSGPEGWVANGKVASYHPDFVGGFLEGHGLYSYQIKWPHPSGQVWFVSCPDWPLLMELYKHLPLWQKGKLYGMA